MWSILYEKLTNSEKEEFKRLTNYLLSHTFIVRDLYDGKEGFMKVSPDYRFVERNFELFLDYLGFSGWTLQKDSNYGVIALSSAYEFNRVRFDRNTTMILYTIRLIYEEEREKLTLRNEVIITTGQIVHKMITLGLVKKKPSDKDLGEALRKLAYFQILRKLEGTWEAADTKMFVLPSILFIVTNEKISRMYESLQAEDQEINGADLQMDGDGETLIRGDEGL
ncbi:protein of unknown function [Geosporobacter subterraneus DSM 17957]|uniref:DUF4194 domain-containing protein n=1 Tax=Geosporobacter subterraneus DSM 17957 TaxID=1121919 RepID=A0A1M6KJC5_9FIRM|nr:DUF4194 domain-containing protein [Geosporobacter subterraneus]SHJ59068.1 protein of unknown function [Geosporobacter subterraneus DSM 17957]